MNEVVLNTLVIVSALFPIVNPVGGAPIFLSLTRDYTSSERSALSWRVGLNSFLLLIGSLVIGTHVLSFFGISISVVQVGGGLVVVSTGWKLLNLEPEEDDEKREAPKRTRHGSITQYAFYPLTLPLTVGPGSISVAITLGANATHHAAGNLLLVAAALSGSLLTALSVYLCYASAERMSRVLGETAMSVVIRLSSFLLVCIGVQILWNGVSALLKTLR